MPIEVLKLYNIVSFLVVSHILLQYLLQLSFYASWPLRALGQYSRRFEKTYTASTIDQ